MHLNRVEVKAGLLLRVILFVVVWTNSGLNHLYGQLEMPRFFTDKNAPAPGFMLSQQKNPSLTLLPKNINSCNNTTYNMILPAPAGGKIIMSAIRSLPSGGSVAAGTIVWPNGVKTAWLAKIANDGTIVTQYQMLLNGLSCSISDLSVTVHGIINVGGIVEDGSNRVFYARFDSTLALTNVSILQFNEKPLKVTMGVVDDYECLMGVQLNGSVELFYIGEMGNFKWKKQLLISGLTELIGFEKMGWSEFGVLTNIINSGKSLTQATTINQTDGAFISSHILENNNRETKFFAATSFANARIISVGYEKTPSGYRPIRNINYYSRLTETRHIYNIAENDEPEHSAAIDLTGDLLGFCLPVSGKLIVIKHFADYQLLPSHVIEYPVPAGSKIFGITSCSDGGNLFGLNNIDSSEVRFLKTDSTGIIAGCNYVKTDCTVEEFINTNNTLASANIATHLYNESAGALVGPTASLVPQFICRENYCPPAPIEDSCQSSYYKTYRSSSYVDAMNELFLMRNNKLITTYAVSDRSYGNTNHVTYGLKLLDEKGNYLRSVATQYGQASTPFSARQMDDKSIMLISNSSVGNTQRITLTLVSDNLQVLWSNTIQSGGQLYSGGINAGIADIEKDEQGNYYVVATNPGFLNTPARIFVLKLNQSGSMIWYKSYETPSGNQYYFLGAEAVLTRTSLIMIIQSGIYHTSVRIDKATGDFINAYKYNTNSAGSLYARPAGLTSNGKILYATNNESGGNQSTLMIASLDTTGKPVKQIVLNQIASIPRVGLVKKDYLYVGYHYWNGSTNREVLAKVDSGLNFIFINEFDLERFRIQRGIAVNDEENIYVSGMFFYGGSSGPYGDGYLQKYDPNGALGTCNYLSINPNSQPIDPAAIAINFTPVNDIIDFLPMPFTLAEADAAIVVDQVICQSNATCNAIKIIDPGPVCKTNTTYNYKYQTNPGCTLKPIWTYDTSMISMLAMTSGSIDLQFKKTGTTWLKAKLNGGCTNYYDSLLIQVQSSPSQFSIGNDTSLCLNDSLILKAGKGFSTYLWQDGSTDSNYIARGAGTYYVKTENACGDIYTDTMHISPAIVPDLTIGPDKEICLNDTISVFASSGFTTYQWTAFPSVIGTGAQVKWAPTENTTLLVKAITREGCSKSDTLTAHVIQARKIFLGADTSICDYDSLALTAGTGYQSYLWSTGNTDSSITAKKSGNYWVVAKDVNGCFAKDTLSILNTFKTPIVSLGADRNLCIGDSLQLDAGNYKNYAWQNGSSERRLVVDQPGIFWVLVTDNNNCKGVDSFEIKKLLPLPANFLPVSDTLCQFDKLRIIPTGNFSGYSWSDGSKASTLQIEKSGIYSLEVTDANGCKGYDTIKIIPKECLLGVYFPNAFTPNADGKNDLFRARVYGKVLYFHLRVYNRYGQLVFSSDDPGKGWDGRISSKQIEAGNFVWVCSYHLEGYSPKTEKGFVILVK